MNRENPVENPMKNPMKNPVETMWPMWTMIHLYH